MFKRHVARFHINVVNIDPDVAMFCTNVASDSFCCSKFIKRFHFVINRRLIDFLTWFDVPNTDFYVADM
jgi:hypothetical protein